MCVSVLYGMLDKRREVDHFYLGDCHHQEYFVSTKWGACRVGRWNRLWERRDGLCSDGFVGHGSLRLLQGIHFILMDCSAGTVEVDDRMVDEQCYRYYLVLVVGFA